MCCDCSVDINCESAKYTAVSDDRHGEFNDGDIMAGAVFLLTFRFDTFWKQNWIETKTLLSCCLLVFDDIHKESWSHIISRWSSHNKPYNYFISNHSRHSNELKFNKFSHFIYGKFVAIPLILIFRFNYELILVMSSKSFVEGTHALTVRSRVAIWPPLISSVLTFALSL